MKLKDFNLTFHQFADIIQFEKELIAYWRTNYAAPYATDLFKDVEDYIRGYQQGENDNDQAIMYWLLVEMNVIDPFSNDVDAQVQRALERA